VVTTLLDNETLLSRWLQLRVGGQKLSRGLIVESRACPFDNDPRWLPPGTAVWDLEREIEAPQKFDVLLLRGLDAATLTETGRHVSTPSRSLHLLGAATTAVRRGVPILVHTTGRFAELKKPAATDVSPFEIDVTRLLALEELVYLLQVHCELPVPDVDPNAAALYLTPIERRLADVLRQEGIPFTAQVRVAEFVVDFLIDGNLVVECDGEAWHDPAKDEIRDTRLRDLNLKVVRFTGRAIHRDAEECVRRVKTERLARESRKFQSVLKMTDAQRRAASHIDGPAMVVAPAGSGKTRVIEERVRWLVASGVEQSRICVLSFTNAAVGEVQDRLEGFPDVAVRTLSKMANQISVSAFGKKTIIENQRDPRVPTPVQIVQQAAAAVGYHPKFREGMWTSLRDALFSYRGSFVVPGSDELGIALEEKQGESPASYAERCKATFLRVHDEYQKIMEKRSLQDFNGQVIDAIRVLTSDFQTRLRISEEYDYWLIDEFQDLAQPKIILARLVASPARNLMVVGDDDQIIYGFAGAEPQSFSVLDRDWRDMTALPLDKNFRSPHEIVVRTRWMIERNKNRIPKNTTPHRELDPFDSVFVQTDPSRNYADAAVEEFLELRKTRPVSDFVFLFRTSMAAAPVELLLSANGVKYDSLARQSLLHNRTASWVISWLRVINDREATSEDWRSVLTRPPRYFTTETVNWISSAEDPYQRIRQCVENQGRGVVGASEKQKNERNIGLLVDQLKSIERTIDAARRFPDSLESQLRQLNLEETLQNEEETSRNDSSSAKAPVQGDGKSVDPKVVYKIVSLMASLAGSWGVLAGFLARAESDPDINLDINDKKEASPDSLRLMTIHGFKGRECPIVFVLGPRTGYMPDRRSTEPHQLEEERRVAYVAATRARERLYFWCSELYERELSARADGLTWEMYRQGLVAPPVVRAESSGPGSSGQTRAKEIERPAAVREEQPGLLETALKWLMKKVFG
jgi:DNA helicase-2/ATP-dependent DNA helicase PcrA